MLMVSSLFCNWQIINSVTMMIWYDMIGNVTKDRWNADAEDDAGIRGSSVTYMQLLKHTFWNLITKMLIYHSIRNMKEHRKTWNVLKLRKTLNWSKENVVTGNKATWCRKAVGPKYEYTEWEKTFYLIQQKLILNYHLTWLIIRILHAYKCSRK